MQPLVQLGRAGQLDAPVGGQDPTRDLEHLGSHLPEELVGLCSRSLRHSCPSEGVANDVVEGVVLHVLAVLGPMLFYSTASFAQLGFRLLRAARVEESPTQEREISPGL